MKYKIYKNKITALLLTAVMLMGAFASVGVIGAETDSADTTAVKFLTALGIINLDENTGMLWDDTPVRRAEMAEILCKMFNAEVTEGEASTFTDVRGEEKAYIETAVANGYMSGHGDGTFGPDEYILNEQLIKIFVSALGGGQVAEYMGGYPIGYANVAKRIGLTKNLSGSLTDIARRADVASMIYDAMHADVFEIDYMGTDGAKYDRTKGETFLTEALNIYSFDGVVKKNEATSLNRPTGAGEGKIQVDDTVLNDSNRLADNYLGCYVEVYAKKSDNGKSYEVVYIEETDNKIYTIKDEDVSFASEKEFKYYDGDKERSVSFSDTPDMVYNGKAVDFDVLKLNVKCGYVKLIDNNRDNRADVAIVTEYDTYIVNQINKAKEQITFKHGENALELKDNFYRIYKNGSAVSMDDIAEDDVLLVAESESASDGEETEKAVVIVVSSDYTMGSIDKIRTDNGYTYITVSGVEYKIGDYCQKLIRRGITAAPAAGVSGKFRLDVLGNVAVYTANASGMSMGYMIQTSTENNLFDSALAVKIYTESGKIEVFQSENKIKLNGTNTEISSLLKNSDMMTKLGTPQLIKYKVKENKLTEITLAEDSYNATEFSKDVEKSLRCTNTSVLADTYYMTSNTKVFLVPDFVTDETNYYGISNGSYIVRDRDYNGAYYDIESDGRISYAVIKSSSSESGLLEGSPLMAITAVLETRDSDGDDAVAVEGYDESGNLITVVAKEKTVADGIKAGDVIRYRTDFNGCMAETKKLVSCDDTTYSLYTIANSTKYVLGEVGYKGSEQLSVCGKAVNANLSPLDMIKIVYNNGNAMFRYTKATGKMVKIDFSDIEYGDKIFACVSGGNATKLLVIYE